MAGYLAGYLRHGTTLTTDIAPLTALSGGLSQHGLTPITVLYEYHLPSLLVVLVLDPGNMVLMVLVHLPHVDKEGINKQLQLVGATGASMTLAQEGKRRGI